MKMRFVFEVDTEAYGKLNAADASTIVNADEMRPRETTLHEMPVQDLIEYIESEVSGSDLFCQSDGARLVEVQRLERLNPDMSQWVTERVKADDR